MFHFHRLTDRTNNAAPVAAGATKPTSSFGRTPVDSKLVVIAHLSDEVRKYELENAASLQEFIGNELQFVSIARSTTKS